MKIRRLTAIMIFSCFLPLSMSALEFTDIHSGLADAFDFLTDPNEGITGYRSLMVPFGGRAESLGGAFTGLSDDISFFQYNAAGSCILKNTEISAFHNSWIADSQMETLAYSSRLGHLGFGGYISCFYVPFTEYNIFGTGVASGHYAETTVCLNASYNLWAGYTFKGLALGASLKSTFRSVPDFTDNDTNQIISNSGLSQSGLALMADAGILFQFNFAKFYASRDANLRIGVAVKNFGSGITGLGGNAKTTIDDPLPSEIAAGISYRFIKPVIITMDFHQPFALIPDAGYQMFYTGAGLQIDIADFISVLTGFQIKGANPKISLGAEMEVKKVRISANYTLDLTSSFTPVNQFSLSAKIILGDHGRKSLGAEIDRLYSEGVLLFAESNYESAISVWNEVLELDPRFDPAIKGIESAKKMMDMFQKIKDSMFLEETK